MKLEIYNELTSAWVDITPWIAWGGLSFSRNDVDAPNTGRDMTGTMHRGRVAVKEKMNVKTVPLKRADMSTLLNLLHPETINVRVTPYPRTNARAAFSMYTNNVSVTHITSRAGGEELETASFPLIEN